MFVIPCERGNPCRNTAWVVYSLIAANTVIFFSIVFLPSYESIIDKLGFTPLRHETVTLFSSMFLHAGFWHLAGNMFFLWMFGDNVEDVVGPLVFIVTYVLGGLGATTLHWLTVPHSTIPCVGASGAISAVVGMYAVFFPRLKTDLELYLGWWHIGSVKTSSLGAIGAWLGEQGLLGLTSTYLLRQTLGVAFWAHVGGLMTGVALGFIFLSLGYRTRHRNSSLVRHWLLGHAKGERHSAVRLPPRQERSRR